MQRRLWIVFGTVCVLFAILIGRLMYIEYTSGDKYKKIVLSQQEFDSSVIPYKRGDITDRKGMVLATSIDVYNVILDSKVVNETKKQRDKDKPGTGQALYEMTLSAIEKSFPEVDMAKVESVIKDEPESQYKILAKDVPYEEMKAYSDIGTEKGDDREVIKGAIWFEKEYQRQYPYGTLAAQLIGFTQGANNGLTGLENEYNRTLSGVNGRKYGYLESESSVEQTVIEPENGNTITTSIDTNVQSVVEHEIEMWNTAHISEGSLGSKNTSCIVMDPNNGEILAMATYPTFDLNDPRDLTRFFTEEQIAGLDDQTQMDFLNRLWQNFPVTHTYEPGSTFKPFTIACGLDTGTLSGNEVFFCDGGEKIGPDYVSCESHHGQLDVGGSLAASCNDALMQMSYSIGPNNFYDYQRLFGFGQRTGIDLPGETRTDTLLYSEKDLGRTINLATNSFGQNFNVTMIQLATAFSSIVNGGTLYQPHIVTAVYDTAGNVVEKVEPSVIKKTVSKEISEQMKQYLRTVVTDGTGTIASVEGYDLGGKTGTAEKYPRSANTYLVSFIGYAPQEDPEVVIYVTIDEPNEEDQAHSSYAQEIAHNILTQILPYLNIEKTEVQR